MASTIKHGKPSTIQRKLRCGTTLLGTVGRRQAWLVFVKDPILPQGLTLEIVNHADARKFLRDFADLLEWQSKHEERDP